MSQGKNSIPNEVHDVVECLRLVKANHLLLVAAAAGSTLVVLINLTVVALLFPLAEGLIKQDFTRVTATVFGLSIKTFPPFLQTNTRLFCSLLVLMYSLVLVKCALAYSLTLTVATQAEKSSAALRMLLISRYLSFGKQYIDKVNADTINALIYNSTTWIARQITAFHALLTEALMLTAYVLLMLWISPPLTLCLALVVPAILFVFRATVNRIHKMAREHISTIEELNLRTAGLVKIISLVQAFGTEQRELDKLKTETNWHVGLATKYLGLHSVIEPFQEVGTMTAQLMAAFALALVIPIASLDPRDVFVFFYLSSKVVPLSNLLNQFRLKLLVHAGSMDALRALMVDDDKFIVSGGNLEFKTLRDAICVNKLSFSYDGKASVFDDVSIKLKADSVTALVGRTGVGKTTMSQLLLRLYDCAPQSIFFDGTDVREFSIHSVKSKIALVDNQGMLIDSTLRENLCYGLSSPVDPAFLEEAIEIAQLQQLISELPDGLDSQLGGRVSAGQKQRIALCRAILRDAPILILDEATSALDPKTEELIMKALKSKLRGKTVLLTSHRLCAVKYADYVYVFEDRHVAQSGTLSDVSGVEGAFTRCFNIEPARNAELNSVISTEPR